MKVTYVLIALNLIVYFYQSFFAFIGFDSVFGLNFYFFDGFYWQIFTSMFLHANLSHIIMNMAVLFQFGSIMQRYLAAFKFALLYLIGGMLTNILSLSYVFFINKNANMVGASGAICVLLGFFAHTNKSSAKGIIIAVLLMSFLPEVFNIVSGINSFNVAWYAHIFGLGIGYLAALMRLR